MQQPEQLAKTAGPITDGECTYFENVTGLLYSYSSVTFLYTDDPVAEIYCLWGHVQMMSVGGVRQGEGVS